MQKNGKKYSSGHHLMTILLLLSFTLPSRAQMQATGAGIGAGTSVNLSEITWLCPQRLIGGDREFGGHGPEMKCSVTIRVSPDKQSILADLKLWAKETAPNYSETDESWTRMVYQAPYGRKIDRILSDTYSGCSILSPPGGFQFIVPGPGGDIGQKMLQLYRNTLPSDKVLSNFGVPVSQLNDYLRKQFISQLTKTYSSGGNTVVQSMPNMGGTLVKYFHIVGDTGGDDISNDSNCKDDTRIEKIEFFPVTILFTN